MNKYTFYNLKTEEEMVIKANNLWAASIEFQKRIPKADHDKWAMSTV